MIEPLMLNNTIQANVNRSSHGNKIIVVRYVNLLILMFNYGVYKVAKKNFIYYAR